MYSRDTTVLIDLLWFNVVLVSVLFFDLATIVPENSCFSVLVMIVIEIQYSDTALLLPHSTLKQWCHAPHLCIYCLKRKSLRCQLCSTHYTAVQINNCLKRTSAIKVATMKITDNFCYEWKPSCAYHKIDTFCGEQRWMERKGGHHEKFIACIAVWQKAPLRLKWLRTVKKRSSP